MPSDETTLLVPKVNSLNWRRKCCKHFSWRCFFWIVYSLLLMTDVAVSVHYNFRNFLPNENSTDTSYNDRSSFTVLVSRISKLAGIASVFPPRVPDQPVPTNQDPGNKDGEGADRSANKTDDVVDIHDQYAECIFSSGLDTLNCWIFLVIVATSQPRVGCLSTLRNLIFLPRFWTLLFLLALYVAGCLLYLSHFRTLLTGIPIGCIVTDILHAFTMMAMVGILNYTEVRNLVQGRSRYKKVLLKGVLYVFFFNLLLSLIRTIYDVNLTLFLATDDITFITPVTNVLLLPFVIKITDLIWTKIFHDNKCIIGEYQSDSFNKENTV